MQVQFPFLMRAFTLEARASDVELAFSPFLVLNVELRIA